MTPAVTYRPVQKITAGSRVPGETIDAIVIEEPLEITLQFGHAAALTRETISVTMRTPGHDEELATGYLFTEGIIPAADVINSVVAEGPDHILLTLKDNISPNLEKAARHSYTNSSCGVCGKTSVDSLFQSIPATSGDISVDAGLLYALPAALNKNQDIFTATGGLHAAALFDRDARLIAIREDIGRHNALDKIVGLALSRRLLPLSDSILLLSGRACFELLQKAALAGIKMVAAIGPPSSLAIRLAEESDITLVGFLREQRFNVYTGAHRINFKYDPPS